MRNFLSVEDALVCESALTAVRRSRCRQNSLADRIGMDPKRLNEKLHGHDAFTSGEIIRLSAELRTGEIFAAMQYHAAIDVVADVDITALRATNAAAEKECFEATHTLNAALADGKLTDTERRDVLRENTEAEEALRKQRDFLEAVQPVVWPELEKAAI